MARFFTLLGAMLNIGGTFVACRVIWLDWHEHERRPWFPRLAALRWWYAAHVSGRRPSRTVVLAEGIASLEGFGTLTARGIPSISEPTERQIEYLRREVDDLHRMLSQQRSEVTAEIAAVAESVSAVHLDAAKAIERVDAKIVKVAVGSAHLEMRALALIGAGTFIAALPLVFGWR